MPRSSVSQPLRRTKAGRLPVIAIALECAGFCIIASVSWLDELTDLPHYLFGAPASPFRPQEAILESMITLLVCIAFAFTARLTRHFENLIVLCAWCRRVRIGEAWVSFEDFLGMHQAETSHAICAECAAEHEAESDDPV